MPEGDVLFLWARDVDSALRDKELVAAMSTRVQLASLRGHKVVRAYAHGKQLLVEFDDGRLLRSHMRMHGRIRVREGGYDGPLVNPHVRWLLASADKTALCLDAPVVELLHVKTADKHPVLSRLGPDILAPELDLPEILRRLRGQPDVPMGTAVMDQEILAGIGNVYKSEALFMAELSPFVTVGALDDETLTRVVEIGRKLMRRNLGPTRRTTPQGRIASPYWVYGRSGEPCFRCGARVQMRRQEPIARSTYYCPACQLPIECNPL